MQPGRSLLARGSFGDLQRFVLPGTARPLLSLSRIALRRVALPLTALALLLVLTFGQSLAQGLSPVAVTQTQTATQHAPTPPTADEAAREAHTYLSAWLESGRFSGSALVSRQGELLLSRGYGRANLRDGPDRGGPANSERTPFRIGSLSKQFTAAAVLRLQQDGLVDLDAPLVRYLPELAVSREITLHQLLTHSSGLGDYTSLPDYTDHMATATGLEELSERIAAIPPLSSPGAGFHYSNSNYVLLAAVVQELTGTDFDSYLSEVFFAPLGMCGTWSGESTPEGSACQQVRELSSASGYIFTGDDYVPASPIHLSQAAGAGGVTSTTADLLIWANALLAGEALSEESRRAIFGRQVAAGPSASGSDAFYGYGWFRSRWRSGYDLISHGGGVNGFSSQLMILPAAELVVVVLSNLDGAPVPEMADGLAAIALGEPYALPRMREAVELAAGAAERLAGRYALGPATVIELVADSGKLYLGGPGPLRFRLFPMSESHFFLRNAEVELQFVSGDSGEVLGVVLHRGGASIPGRRLD